MERSDSDEFEATWWREMGRIAEMTRHVEVNLDWQAQELAKKELGPRYRHCFPPKGSDSIYTFRTFF